MAVAKLNFSSVTEHRLNLLAKVLWTLHHDGPFKDDSGRAVGELREALIRRHVRFDPAYIAGLVKQLDSDEFGRPLIRREMPNPRRCSLVELAVPTTTPGFPPDPFEDTELQPEAEEEVGEVATPGTDLEPVPDGDERTQDSPVDLILFAISLLGDAIQRLNLDSSLEVAGVLNQHVPALIAQIKIESDRADLAERRNAQLAQELQDLRRTRLAFDRVKLRQGTN